MLKSGFKKYKSITSAILDGYVKLGRFSKRTTTKDCPAKRSQRQMNDNNFLIPKLEFGNEEISRRHKACGYENG
jgi:hypothetical protein